MRVRFAYSEEFEIKVGVHQGSVLLPLLFPIIVDVITKEGIWLINYCMQMTLFS